MQIVKEFRLGAGFHYRQLHFGRQLGNRITKYRLQTFGQMLLFGPVDHDTFEALAMPFAFFLAAGAGGVFTRFDQFPRFFDGPDEVFFIHEILPWPACTANLYGL